ncbi:MAG: glycoside hydrolase family 3 C-terminal domain-containing protein [Chitinophagaceae bacterium]|nr:glycoside hydrolase family 3 C-terminal domain-containing protein [Chitinophagaceae bacterium]
MKFAIPFLLFILVAGTKSLFAQTEDISKLASQLTAEEKVKLVVGMGMNTQNFAIGSTGDKVPGAAGTTFDISRLNIPKLVLADGPAGLRIAPNRANVSRTFYATAFPIGTLLASSWDTVLVKKVGEAYGEEARDYGVDIVLGPALNIHRNPLGGRNFEYYSEDPFVAGNITSSMVNGIQSKGVGVSIKHFAVNNQETNRMLVNAVVSERALREIYLRGFEIAIKKSSPMTVMSSYNKLNGVYTSESYDLLTTILRNEWGFKGLVMSDWFGGQDAVAQMKAGNDLLMPGTKEQEKSIREALAAGTLSDDVLTLNASRVIRMTRQSNVFRNLKYNNDPDLKAHALVSRQAASEGMVLLKNNADVLPLAANTKNLAAFGITSYNLISGGTGSGDVNEAYSVSLTEGLSNAGYQLDGELMGIYKTYIDTQNAHRPKPVSFFMPQIPMVEMDIDRDLVNRKAAETDIALLTIGRNSGEFADRKVDSDYLLSPFELKLIKTVSDAYHAQGKKLVVVLNIGGVIDVSAWRDQADAILLSWQGGQEGGNAIADILKGKVNPSGKLATSFPEKYQDLPSSKNFPGKNLSDKEVKGTFGMSLGYPSEVVYEEGVYNGYRYFNSFRVKPAYEFGFGLSYTTFSYGAAKLAQPVFNGKAEVSLTVTNSGNKAGREVVQLYLSAPAGGLDKPSEELKGFAKTKLLKPGESQVIKFVLTADELASYETARSSWVAAAGIYTVKIGASSRDFRQQAQFTVSKELIAEKCHSVIVPQVTINEMKN